MKEQLAQGDVLLTRVSTKPRMRGSVAPECGLLILARGEATGHHHSVLAERGTLELDEGGVMYLTIDQLTQVTHQEHGPLVLEPGVYRMDRQQECDAFGHWRQVAD